MFFTVTLAPGTTAPDVSVTVPDSDEVAPPWAKVEGAPRAATATTRKAQTNSLRTASVMHCSLPTAGHADRATCAELVTGKLEGSYATRRGSAPNTGLGPLLPRPVYRAYAANGIALPARRQGLNGQICVMDNMIEQHVTPPSAFASSPAGTGSCDEPARLDPRARLRMLLGAHDRRPDQQHVRRRGLRRIHLDQIEAVESADVDPGGIDQASLVRRAVLIVPVASAFRRNEDGVTADFKCKQPVTGTGRTSKPSGAIKVASCSTPSALVRREIPTNTLPGVTSTSPPSSVPGASMNASGRYARSAAADRVNFRPPRRRARPRDDRQIVEHHRRVLDKHRVGQLRRIRQALDSATKTPQHRLVRVVLRHSARVVDRLTLEMRQLAVLDAGRDRAGESETVTWRKAGGTGRLGEL